MATNTEHRPHIEAVMKWVEAEISARHIRPDEQSSPILQAFLSACSHVAPRCAEFALSEFKVGTCTRLLGVVHRAGPGAKPLYLGLSTATGSLKIHTNLRVSGGLGIGTVTYGRAPDGSIKYGVGTARSAISQAHAIDHTMRRLINLCYLKSWRVIA